MLRFGLVIYDVVYLLAASLAAIRCSDQQLSCRQSATPHKEQPERVFGGLFAWNRCPQRILLTDSSLSGFFDVVLAILAQTCL